MLYVYVGGRGIDAYGGISGGWNGGGASGESNSSGSGGGATDFRIDGNGIGNRFLVAGGGGGASNGSLPGGAGGAGPTIGTLYYGQANDDGDGAGGGGGYYGGRMGSDSRGWGGGGGSNYFNTAYGDLVSSINGGGSSGNGSASITYLSNYLYVPDPVREGYTFAGWTVSGPGDVNNHLYEYVVGDTTITANWIKNATTSSLTVNPNGGLYNDSREVTTYEKEAGKVQSVPNPTRQGYKFTGWTLSGGGSFSNGVFTFNGTDATLTANWEILKYTLTINPNSGVYNGSSEIVVIPDLTSESVLSVPNPTKKGHTFIIWNITGTGAYFAQDGFHMGASDITITAEYQINSYILTVYPNGGIWEGRTNSQNFTLNFEATRAIPVPTPPEHYVFTEWTLTGEDATMTDLSSNATFKMGVSNATLTANFVPEKSRVIYNYWENGGESSTLEEDEVYYANPVDLTPIATKVGDPNEEGTYDPNTNKDGWQFVGWNTDPNAKIGLTEDEAPLANGYDIVLYAIYKKELTVTTLDVAGTGYNTKFYTYYVYNKDTYATHKFEYLAACQVATTSGQWSPVGWSLSPDPFPETIYEVNDTYSLVSDKLFYGIYTRQLKTYFISYDGLDEITETVEGEQRLNASNISSLANPSIKTPDAHIYTGEPEKGEWYVRGWTLNKTNNPPNNEIIDVGAYVTNSSVTTYYAVYGKDLTITYYDMLDDSKNTFTQSALQIVNSYKINNIYSPSIYYEELHSFTGWEPVGWTTKTTGTTPEYYPGGKRTLNDNLELYGIYNRNVTVTFIEAANISSQSKVQNANASDIEATKTSVNVTTPYINNYNDGKLNWTGKFWTKDTANDVASGIASYAYITTKEDETYYARYNTGLIANFMSINGTTRYTDIVTGTATMNAGNPLDIKYPEITTPNLKVSKYANLTWSALGWSLSTSADDSDYLLEGDKYTLTNSTITFYGLYQTGVKATFIDYNGFEKRTRVLEIGKLLNSYSFNQVDSLQVAPEIGVYNDGTSNWYIKGWSSATIPNPTSIIDEGDEFNISAQTTFYAVYEKPITLTLVDYEYLSATKRERQYTKNIYANSYNITNINEAVFTIDTMGLCSLNGKTWNSLGWTSLENTTIPEYYSGHSITISSDTTLYGLYNRTITITYNGNGGNSVTASTGSKVISASGAEVNPEITITSVSPRRTGYVFMKLWKTDTNKGDEYVPGQTYTFNDDITLFAQWGIDTIDKTVTIVWDDNSNNHESRPDKVYVNLYRDGIKVQSYMVSALNDTICSPEISRVIPEDGQIIYIDSSKDEFKFLFKDLQQYSPTDGHEYYYTVEQAEFESNHNDLTYATSYSGDTWTITNTLINSGEKQIVGTVFWEDSSDAWFLRPETIVLTLLRTDPDTEEVISYQKTFSVTAADSFAYKFVNLEHMNANGTPYIYKVIESDIVFYTITSSTGENVDGITYFNFYNKLKGLPTSLSGLAGNKLIISADAFNFKGENAIKEDYYTINSTEEETVLVTLKEVKKSWEGTDENAVEIYDINSLTGREYNVIVSPREDTIVDYLYDGKYEVVVHDDSLYDFSKFAAESEELINTELTIEDGRYFITFSSKYEYSAILNLHAHIILRPWRGYTCIKEMYKEKD